VWCLQDHRFQRLNITLIWLMADKIAQQAELGCVCLRTLQMLLIVQLFETR
jgi:hypothetical protein